MSEHTYMFPCSRMDLPRLERWFEERAGRGKMISRLSLGLGNGVYEDIFGGKYHFCVRPFARRLDDNAQRSQEFMGFKQDFEERGWTFQCGLANLAVFYSKDDQRPSEPEQTWEEDRDLLLRVTEKAELRFAAVDAVTAAAVLPLTAYALMSSYFRLYARLGVITPGLLAAHGAIILTLFLGLTVFRILPCLQAGRALRRGQRSPAHLPFWNRRVSIALSTVSLAALQAFADWYLGRPVALVFCMLSLAVALTALSLRAATYKKTGPSTGEKLSKWLVPVEIALLAAGLLIQV